jgi:hypothetical protein
MASAISRTTKRLFSRGPQTQLRLEHADALSALASFSRSTAQRSTGGFWRIPKPYLYKNDGSGQPAIRPVITTASPQSLLPGNTINITLHEVGQTERTGVATKKAIYAFFRELSVS